MKHVAFGRPLRSTRSLIVLFLVLFPAAWLPSTPAAAQSPDLFGFTAMPVPAEPDLSPYTKWNDMVRRMQQQTGWENESCTNIFSRCPQQDWKKLLSDASRQSKSEQLDAVNRFVNKFDYIPDTVNWGGIDYWETPKEFFQKGGECKDYAIAKYFTLRILGWPVESLWVIVLQDMNLNVTHAVLAVKHEGKALILDNQVPDIVEEHRIHHYRPIFGLDEAGWVYFRPPH